MVFEFDDSIARNARMKVVGVGGAGGNAVNRMIDEKLDGVEFIAVNTDSQALKESESHIKIQIGKRLTRGLGAGARPEIGRQAIAETEDEVRKALDNCSALQKQVNGLKQDKGQLEKKYQQTLAKVQITPLLGSSHRWK